MASFYGDGFANSSFVLFAKRYYDSIVYVGGSGCLTGFGAAICGTAGGAGFLVSLFISISITVRLCCGLPPLGSSGCFRLRYACSVTTPCIRLAGFRCLYLFCRFAVPSYAVFTGRNFGSPNFVRLLSSTAGQRVKGLSVSLRFGRRCSAVGCFYALLRRYGCGYGRNAYFVFSGRYVRYGGSAVVALW